MFRLRFNQTGYINSTVKILNQFLTESNLSNSYNNNTLLLSLTVSQQQVKMSNNVWGNVYWNNKNDQENRQIMGNHQSPFNNINMGNMQSGPFGSSWKSSGHSSLPLNTHQGSNILGNSGPSSWRHCGSTSNVWGSKGNSRNMSTDVSRASSVSSQAWGEMMDGAILDELKSAKSSPFSSLSYHVNKFWGHVSAINIPVQLSLYCIVIKIIIYKKCNNSTNKSYVTKSQFFAMTTFCTGGVKCVGQTSFCLSSLYPLRTAVSACAWSMGVCVHFTDWSQASFFQPWFPPRAKPVRVSNIVYSRHSAKLHIQSP